MHAEFEFFNAERFGNIVVATQFEAFNTLFLRDMRGKDDDRGVVVNLADVLQQAESVFALEHDVDDAEIELVGVVSLGGKFPVFEIYYLITRDFEVVFNDVAEIFAIVN